MNTPILIEENNLSLAWLKIFDKITNSSGNEISPLVLTLTGFEESLQVKNMLNAHLQNNKHNSIETVSETIFPNSLYNYCEHNREELYKTYQKSLLRIKKIDSANRRGTYFERLIAFDKENKINQLEIIIKALKDKRTRRSKLQASIFDPKEDHLNDAYQKFPCLQHITFFKSETGGLILNSFYAIQYLYQKAYGNWLGLINLGRFVAEECEMDFERFNCFVGVEQMEPKISKGEAKELLKKMRS